MDTSFDIASGNVSGRLLRSISGLLIGSIALWTSGVSADVDSVAGFDDGGNTGTVLRTSGRLNPFLPDIAIIANNPGSVSDLHSSIPKRVADSTIGTADALWSDQYTLGIGCNGAIYAVARLANGNYAVGGDFSSCGNVPAQNLAQFDPAAQVWSAIHDASHMSGPLGGVRAMTVDGDDLYVGSGETVYHWDGSTWHRLGGRMYEAVQALAFHDGTLYAGGDFGFFDDSDNYVEGVTRWNGTAWEALRSGHGGLTYNVRSLVVFNGELVAGGNFHTGGSLPGSNLSRIARWDGMDWQPLGSHGGNGVSTTVPQQHSYVAAMTVWNNALYVTGHFTAANAGSATHEVAANGVARWDGAQWSAVGAGIAGGNGRAVIGNADNLFVGGTFTSAGDVSAARVARWDGAMWNALTPTPAIGPLSAAVFALAEGADGVLVGGEFGVASPSGAPDASAHVVNHIGEWVGEELRALGSSPLHGVNGPVVAMVRFKGDLYIAGLFSSVAGVAANNIARWDGSSWHAVGEGAGNGADNVVSVLQVVGDDLFVGGRFSTVDIGGTAKVVNAIARWDGSAWHALDAGGQPGVGGTVNALLWSAPYLYVAGTVRVQDSLDVSKEAVGIARWDGEHWTSMGPGDSYVGISGVVNALAMVDSDLYAGGRIAHVSASGGDWTPVLNLVRWDGSQWQPVGSNGGLGVSYYDLPDYFGQVVTLEAHSTDLYVGGVFTLANTGSASPLPVRNLARWDGAAWHSVGLGADAGANGGVVELKVWQEKLLVGGTFDSMLSDGTTVAIDRLAVWDGLSWSSIGGGLPGIGSVAYVIFPEANAGLRVGGKFSIAGDMTSSNLAHFDPASESIFTSRFESIAR